MSYQDSRKPDFVIKALNKETQERAPVGGMWNNGDGSFYIKFNPFVVLPPGGVLAITAFPNEEREAGSDDRPERETASG